MYLVRVMYVSTHGVLCVCRLLVCCRHFNYEANILVKQIKCVNTQCLRGLWLVGLPR